jgi:DNA-binding MarR family transcriptional regulator
VAATRMPLGVAGDPNDRTLSGAAESLLESLSAIRRNGRRRTGRPGELAPLTGAQLELVRVVRRQPGISVAEAAAALHLAANTVSTLVGQLVDRGLVLRRADLRDRRVARLELAPEIRRKVDAWRDRRTLSMTTALLTLSDTDRRRILEALPALDRLGCTLGDDEVWR